MHVKLLRCAFLRATTTSTQFPALWRMYLEIILWRMFARRSQWLLCNDATVSVVSVLGPVWPCLIVLERLRRQQLARPARQAPPAGSDCLCRLPRLLQETVAPGPDAAVARAIEALPGTREDCWLAPWPFCGGTATQASCRDSLSRRSAWMGMLSC